MKTLTMLALSLACATTACSSEDAGGPTQSVANSTEIGMLTLQVDLKWSVGEGSEDAVDDNIVLDEDWGDYTWSGLVELGPVEACSKPAGERTEGAVCSWDGPSTWWNTTLLLRAGNRFDIDLWAGDADTAADLSLPAAALPKEAQGPVSVSFSPDNASGAWGHISASVFRVETPADEPVDGDNCCVTCSAGVACGDGCIAANATCHQAPGCACQG